MQISTDSIAEQLHQFAESLGNAVDARDTDTFNQSWEVAEFARMIAEAMGLSSTQVETLHLAAHLHDIGKIGIADVVLKKQGRLSEEEWDLMKRHPEIGALIIRPIEAFASSKGGRGWSRIRFFAGSPRRRRRSRPRCQAWLRSAELVHQILYLTAQRSQLGPQRPHLVFQAK